MKCIKKSINVTNCEKLKFSEIKKADGSAMM